MISTDGIKLSYGQRVLFDKVSLKFTPGNCYGIIGANGSGKSTFLKIISGQIEPSAGTINIEANKRLGILKQDQFAYDACPVLETVIRGNHKLFSIIQEKEALYAKPDFSDADGLRVADLEAEFTELNGWDAESDAAKLLSDLGIAENLHNALMQDLSGKDKVKVLLAQSLFGNPDILIMDEPTNNLDGETIIWLENFLANFPNTVLLVSHDRHFLNNVCTHIVDIDYGTMKMFSGNYAFWQEASQLAVQQAKESNKRIEAKREELKSFIQRFSANASKAKQATSRKNLLEKLQLEDIAPSSRRYPHIFFRPNREIGEKVLEVSKLSYASDTAKLLNNISFNVNRGDKIAFMGNTLSISALFDIIMGVIQPSSGKFEWGSTTSQAYFPKDNNSFFKGDTNLIAWLKQYVLEDVEDEYIRGFLGKMLFSGDESLKKTNVLSGGEKVRCMFARMMIVGANVLVLDEPTAHLDLESITSVNNGLMNCNCVVLFSSQDFQFTQTIANRIIEITPKGMIDRAMTYEEYLFDPKIKEARKAL